MINPLSVGERFLFIAFQIFLSQAMWCVSTPVAAFAVQSTEQSLQAAAGSEALQKQSRLEISYGGNKLVLFSDTLEEAGGKLQRAKGNVTITFLDMVLTCEEAEYDEETLRVSTRNPTRFRSRKVSLTSSGATFDPLTETVTLRDASGYFYDTSGRSDREYFLTGGMSQNIKAPELDIHWGAEKKD
jgi:hypothetical protein